jgi:hypothetical protein
MLSNPGFEKSLGFLFRNTAFYSTEYTVYLIYLHTNHLLDLRKVLVLLTTLVYYP